jgi:WD40 repeat protein
VTSRETRSWHSAAIACARFSPDGGDVASGSADGTARVWTPAEALDSPRARNATIHCGREVQVVEWSGGGDGNASSSAVTYNTNVAPSSSLLIGTRGGGLRVWNVDAKRVTVDAAGDENFPNFDDVRSSPTEHVFACATSSDARDGAITMWNSRRFEPMHALAMGPRGRSSITRGGAPLIHALAFNHNSKLLAAASDDGRVVLFDLNSRKVITTWDHGGVGRVSVAATGLGFSADQTSVYSVGGDGVVKEWSLRTAGGGGGGGAPPTRVVDASRACGVAGKDAGAAIRIRMAVDPNGAGVALSSRETHAVFVRLDGGGGGGGGGGGTVHTIPGHRGDVTCVDWHPGKDVVLTGGADNALALSTLAL